MGTAGHHTVELLNKGAILTPEERGALFKQKLIDICVEKDIPLEFTKGFKMVKEMLAIYGVPPGWNFLQGEQKHELLFEADDVVIAYVIDALFTDDEGEWLYIVDYKTNAAPPKSGLQLLLYIWLEVNRLNSLFPDDPIDVSKTVAHFHMLRTGKIVKYTMDQKTFDAMTVWVKTQIKTIKAVVAGEQEPTYNPGEACYWCPIADCPVRK